LEITVKLGANEQIHCPQLFMKKNMSIVMRKTYPDTELSLGSPVGQYHSTQYSTAETIAAGISATMLAVQNATQP
jgi:hypothetical protein